MQNGVIILSGALMGCCCGFLVFNLPPARVFMGDTGSHFLGVALAVISVLGVAKIAVALALFVPLIALGLPIGDTAFAIVRRRRAGRSPTEPDAGHLHHRMLATGMSPMETALTFYLMTAILGCVALFVFGHKRILDVALALLVVALVGLLWRSRRRRPQFDADGFLVVRRPPQRARPGSSRRRGRLTRGGERGEGSQGVGGWNQLRGHAQPGCLAGTCCGHSAVARRVVGRRCRGTDGRGPGGGRSWYRCGGLRPVPEVEAVLVISKSVSARPAHVVRSAALACIAAAVACALVGTVVGHRNLWSGPRGRAGGRCRERLRR